MVLSSCDANQATVPLSHPCDPILVISGLDLRQPVITDNRRFTSVVCPAQHFVNTTQYPLSKAHFSLFKGDYDLRPVHSSIEM